MKRSAIRSLVVMMIAVMVFAFTPVPVSAATKAPGRVKITSVKATAASTSKNEANLIIKWKKAKRATGYYVYAKKGNGDWVKQFHGKKLPKSCRKVTLKGASAGQWYIKVQAVNKKKLGKFSAEKSKFIPSKLTLADYANRIDTSIKESDEDNVTISFADNTVTYTCDVSGRINSIDEATAKINAKASELKNAATHTIDYARIYYGISNVTVVYKYIYNGNSNLLPSFTFFR